MIKHSTMPSKDSQQGSILLEALIAFLIFAMGLLGVIGLQATAINNTLDARYRSDAAFLANQIIAQMWADGTTNLASYDCAGQCLSTSANMNVRSWVQQIQGTAKQPAFLPGVSNAANPPNIAVNGNTVTVTMNWQAPQGQQIAHKYETKTEIQFN